MCGGGGPDVLIGGEGMDDLSPGNGRDTVAGGLGRDVVRLVADGAADVVDCGKGYDQVEWMDAVDPLDEVKRCEVRAITDGPDS